MSQFSFKSYSWAVGTTSFRTVDFNLRIELQLNLLDEFWALPGNSNEKWESNNSLQEKYYCFMQEKEFVVGRAKRPDKDARPKTSGLVSIGLIDSERRLTAAGKALQKLVKAGNFKSDNALQVSADSFIYLKQLFKTSVDVDRNIVRPFAITAHVLLRLGYLTDAEFTYLLPLCTTAENMEIITTAIEKLRGGIGNIDDIIKERLMAMDNYKAALSYFVKNSVTENVITAVGMNRKSGGSGAEAYDKPYYDFYKTLRDIALEGKADTILKLYKQSGQIKNNKPASLWRKYLFKTTNRRKLENDGLSVLNDVPLLRVKTENEFKKLFFEQMHLFKAKANLSDYADLNRRYFKTTDTILFADSKVAFDVLPRCWLYSVADDLRGIAFIKSGKLSEDVGLVGIAPFLAIDEKKLHANLQELYGIAIATADDANKAIHDERYRRFNALIDERFSRDVLIDLFDKFENREYDAIRKAVTNNADIYTIFEYVLGIAWYIISERCGEVLSYMNLSLEADLLPRTHAGGGNADIEYRYEETANYPAHCLLLEATLLDNLNQRRGEMEPVSRHLGEYVLKTGDKNAYCVFASTFLHRNVVSDFRNRRTYEYYSDQYKNCVDGLKILPLATKELRAILESGIGYDKLYPLFESAYRSDEPVPTWYEREVAGNIQASISVNRG